MPTFTTPDNQRFMAHVEMGNGVKVRITYRPVFTSHEEPGWLVLSEIINTDDYSIADTTLHASGVSGNEALTIAVGLDKVLRQLASS